MGGAESKNIDLRNEHQFTDEEKKRINFVFASIAHGKKTIVKDHFQHFTAPVLDQATSGRLFDILEGPSTQHRSKHLITHHHTHHNKHEINLQHFGSHLMVLLKGGVYDLAHVSVFLASVKAPGTVSSEEMVKLVSSFLHSYERLLAAHCTAYQSWIFAPHEDAYERLARSLLADLFQPEEVKAPEPSPTTASKAGKVDGTFSESDVSKWLSRCPLFRQVMRQVFHGAFQFYHAEPNQMTFLPRLPQVRDTNWARFQTILDFPSILFLNFSLSSELQTQWKLVFSNNLHGASFIQLLQNVKNKGPSYVVVRDKEGYVFGGFASQSWEINSKFTGTQGCFLFRVKPNFCIYASTGYNKNYMYLNHQVQTLPNGLGMGGQLEFFGMWIDQSVDRGHSKAGSKGCTTYGSPQLSKSLEFEVDIIEVWAVGRNKKPGEDDDDDDDDSEVAAPNAAKGGHKSILDKVDAADKAILGMADRATISDAIREEPLVEETKAHSTIISPY